MRWLGPCDLADVEAHRVQTPCVLSTRQWRRSQNAPGQEMHPYKRWLAAVLLADALGCTASTLTRSIATAGTPAMLHAGLQSMNDRDNQQLLVQLLDSPEMHHAARTFASEVADGTLATLTAPDRVARIEQMLTEYVTSLTLTITRSMALGLQRDLAPAIAVMLREAAGSTLHEVLREGYQHDMERVAAGLTRATVEAATESLADGMRQEMGPALHGVLSDPEMARAVGLMAHTLAREAVLGSNDAMTQIQRAQDHQGQSSFLGRITHATTDGVRIFETGAVAAVLLCLLLGIWVVRLILRSRRVQSENEGNAAAATMFAEAMRSAEGKPWANELNELLQQRLQSDKVSDLVDRVLGLGKAPSIRKSATVSRLHANGRSSWTP